MTQAVKPLFPLLLENGLREWRQEVETIEPHANSNTCASLIIFVRNTTKRWAQSAPLLLPLQKRKEKGGWRKKGLEEGRARVFRQVNNIPNRDVCDCGFPAIAQSFSNSNGQYWVKLFAVMTWMMCMPLFLFLLCFYSRWSCLQYDFIHVALKLNQQEKKKM